MKSTVFLRLCIVGYLLLIFWIVTKLRDIAKNPQKYDLIHGWDVYRASSWYERKYQRCGNHYYASLYVGGPGLFLSPLVYIWLGNSLQKYLYLSNGAQRLSALGLAIGGIASMIYSLGLTQFFVFYGKKPMLVAARLYFQGQNRHRPTAWENMFTWLLVSSLICLPIMTMGIYSCSYADDEKIVTHSLFSVTAQEIPYESVESGTTMYSCNPTCTDFSLEYKITMEDGTELRVDKFEQKGMYYIDARLRENRIPMTYAQMNIETYETLKQKCRDSDVMLIEDFLTISE